MSFNYQSTSSNYKEVCPSTKDRGWNDPPPDLFSNISQSKKTIRRREYVEPEDLFLTSTYQNNYQELGQPDLSLKFNSNYSDNDYKTNFQDQANVQFQPNPNLSGTLQNHQYLEMQPSGNNQNSILPGNISMNSNQNYFNSNVQKAPYEMYDCSSRSSNQPNNSKVYLNPPISSAIPVQSNSNNTTNKPSMDFLNYEPPLQYGYNQSANFSQTPLNSSIPNQSNQEHTNPSQNAFFSNNTNTMLNQKEFFYTNPPNSASLTETNGEYMNQSLITSGGVQSNYLFNPTGGIPTFSNAATQTFTPCQRMEQSTPLSQSITSNTFPPKNEYSQSNKTPMQSIGFENTYQCDQNNNLKNDSFIHQSSYLDQPSFSAYSNIEAHVPSKNDSNHYKNEFSNPKMPIQANYERMDSNLYPIESLSQVSSLVYKDNHSYYNQPNSDKEIHSSSNNQNNNLKNEAFSSQPNMLKPTTYGMPNLLDSSYLPGNLLEPQLMSSEPPINEYPPSVPSGPPHHQKFSPQPSFPLANQNQSFPIQCNPNPFH